jgi:RNA polymerase sigma factor (sigma-70 family)
MTPDSHQLLSDYAGTGSEAAFRELVARYVDLVYSTALRLVDGDTHRAQDVAQTVFLDLARQACRLPAGTRLGGWLHRDACFVAAKMMRGERRRRSWERHAAEMNALENSDDELKHVAPALDEAINALKEEDRTAILLRFYERRDLRSVGEALGTSENAAQKRVARALEQLHAMLTRRGVALSATVLGAALAGEAVSAAPAGLAGSIAGAVLASAVVTTGGPFAVFKAMSIMKFKLMVVSAVAVAAVITPAIVQYQSQTKLREENRSLRGQLDEAARMLEENQRLSNLVAQTSNQQNLEGAQLRELLRLRGEAGRLRNENVGMEQLRQENRQLRAAVAHPGPGAEAASSAGSSEPAPLYARVFLVDPSTLVSKVNSYSPPVSGKDDADLIRQAALRQLLLDYGIQIEPHGELHLNEKEGKVSVHTSPQNLDKIERLIASWVGRDETAPQATPPGPP